MILTRTLQKTGQMRSLATQIGMQINTKLGGEIWMVPIPVCFVFVSFSSIDLK